MPILDAIARRGRIRFVPARGEAGEELAEGEVAAEEIAEVALRVGGRAEG